MVDISTLYERDGLAPSHGGSGLGSGHPSRVVSGHPGGVQVPGATGSTGRSREGLETGGQRAKRGDSRNGSAACRRPAASRRWFVVETWEQVGAAWSGGGSRPWAGALLEAGEEVYATWGVETLEGLLDHLRGAAELLGGEVVA